MLRKKIFQWTEIEEKAWQTAITLTKLNIQLTIPEPTDTLLLTTDASKVAASAVLFTIKNDRLQLVSATSKYFSTADLGKCSYFLEAISLAYGIKCFAPYLLNCQSKILISMDAKALIYAKRMSTHSILLNNTLTYLTNFVSIANVELYYLPGAVNVLADVLSRAIADNLNNKLPKEHPISKQWAKVLPPIPDNFGVDHETLYRFLTRPLQSEPQDLNDRTLRKLMEPKSVFSMYKESQSQTPEQRFHSAQVLLHQWLSEYARKHSKPEEHVAALFHAKIELDLQTQQICIDKIEEIMNKFYEDIKGTPLYKTLQKNLKEVSERYLLCLKNPLTESLLGKLQESQQHLLDTAQIITNTELKKRTEKELKIKYINAIENNSKKHKQPIAYYSLHPEAKILPKICNNSNGLDIPLQEDVNFTPFEKKTVDLKIRFQFPKNHCALLMNKSSARTKYNMNVQLGLIDVGYHDYVKAVLQNMDNKPTTLYAGTAVAQLLLLPSQIPYFQDEWPESQSTRGSFGSTGQDFKMKNSTNYMQVLQNVEYLKNMDSDQNNIIPFDLILESQQSCPLLKIKDALNPDYITINNIRIHLFDEPQENTQEIYILQEFENEILDTVSPYIMDRLPSYQITVASKESPIQETSSTDSEKYMKLFPKHYTVPITPDDLSQLLAAESIQNKKLTLETLIYLQTNDPHIAYIKDNMLGSKPIRKFSLRKGVVCKLSKNATGTENLVIYVPSVLFVYIGVSTMHYFSNLFHNCLC